MECFRYSKCSIDKRGHVKVRKIPLTSLQHSTTIKCLFFTPFQALKVALGNLENGINFQRHGSEVKLDETCPNYPL